MVFRIARRVTEPSGLRGPGICWDVLEQSASCNLYELHGAVSIHGTRISSYPAYGRIAISRTYRCIDGDGFDGVS